MAIKKIAQRRTKGGRVIQRVTLPIANFARNLTKKTKQRDPIRAAVAVCVGVSCSVGCVGLALSHALCGSLHGVCAVGGISLYP